jgi:hypothetical protein
MARRDDNLPLILLLVAGGTWLGLNGSFGDNVQQQLAEMLNGLWSHKSCRTAADNLAQLRAANPNFVAQMWQWKALRISRFENPKDWDAFRTHLTKGLGAPDPGPTPPLEFC